MRVSTIVLLCVTAVGAIAFNPKAASADIDFSTGSQGTSIRIGDPAPVYQPVVVEHRNSESRYREEEYIREEHRLAENRERERFADQRQREQRTNERFADQRQLEHRTDERHATQTSSHVYNSNNNQQNNNSSNNTRRYNR